MNRTGVLIALAIAIVVGLVFGFYPELDLWIAAQFYDPATGRWTVRGLPATYIRNAASWLIALIVAPAVIAIALKLILPRRPMLVPGRAAILMIVTLVLGPGVVANLLLKDQWGRPRPVEVREFRGPDQFLPWWDPRGPCPKNCSFVAGEPSGAFWTLAPAALVPPVWRVLAYGAALAFGAAIGFVRIAGGGHFFSDAVFAGVFMFLVIWLVHGLIYRWRLTRIADALVERWLESEAMRWRSIFAWIAARFRGGGSRN